MPTKATILPRFLKPLHLFRFTKNAYFLSEFLFFAILRLIFQSLFADRPCTVLVQGRQAQSAILNALRYACPPEAEILLKI
jgi:hypothetical protein